MTTLEDVKSELGQRLAQLDEQLASIEHQRQALDRMRAMQTAIRIEVSLMLDRLNQIEPAEKFHVEPAGKEASQPRAPRRDVRAAVLEHLRDKGPATPEELSSALDVPARGIAKALAYWSGPKHGEIKKDGDRWAAGFVFRETVTAAPAIAVKAIRPEPDPVTAPDDATPEPAPPSHPKPAPPPRYSGRHLPAEPVDEGDEAPDEEDFDRLRTTLKALGAQTLTQIEERGVSAVAVGAAVLKGLVREEKRERWTVYALVEPEHAAAE